MPRRPGGGPTRRSASRPLPTRGSAGAGHGAFLGVTSPATGVWGPGDWAVGRTPGSRLGVRLPPLLHAPRARHLALELGAGGGGEAALEAEVEAEGGRGAVAALGSRGEGPGFEGTAGRRSSEGQCTAPVRGSGRSPPPRPRVVRSGAPSSPRTTPPTLCGLHRGAGQPPDRPVTRRPAPSYHRPSAPGPEPSTPPSASGPARGPYGSRAPPPQAAETDGLQGLYQTPRRFGGGTEALKRDVKRRAGKRRV